ncbi:carboxypeptidase-like regulatory domain-containing protein [Psychroserpens luteolus]|uniref:carboxypeptidase-like regulatory domain-containing protein n=1 Tax=Psychroserpens luteolus TaxID=2855840 RepID=UPI001E590C86|nr:carboxypeptidase-like regulatory domain-containing protein [Psychroserpens luteolus]MCD2260296.1 carboxypeptidase-like regulatory domain-containing protein [Psychroserpens luteolus]
MKKIEYILFLIFAVFSCNYNNAQSIQLKGKVVASSDLESIHVLNITAQKFTVTNDKGAFEIPVKLNDTLLISSVQYIPQSFVVTKTTLDMKSVVITLTDRVNELDEVVVGKVLTGNLSSDIENSDAKRDINFYDVGIPGYVGKQKTQKERKLYEADAGKSIVIAPLFVGINIHKILNKISGRTKKLKRAVLLEEQDKCLKKMMAEFSDLLFENYEIDTQLKTEFFYYISDDPKFTGLCKGNNSLKTYEFLLHKLYTFKDVDEETKD